jgi:DNA-binding transcriptional ArsR family regulator
MKDEVSLPRSSWDLGTAYDLFISLEVLHRPAEFGVRRAWAAGVRARLPAPARQALEQSMLLFYVPLHWVHALPDPRDSAAALWALRQTPPADRLPALALPHGAPADVQQVLLRVAARRAWDARDKEALQAAYGPRGGERRCCPSTNVTAVLDGWAHAEEYGEHYLEALCVYHESFFAEEERRIRPALRDALARAQELAKQLALPDLLEELTQGVRFAELSGRTELVLVPSYWCTPYSYMVRLGPKREIWTFGARPADASLVPGEAVPDAVLRALKALSDPTRLRILRSLAEESLTQAQLARRLRLRAPTITHHLSALRAAGLVGLTIEDMDKKTKHYTVRPKAVETALAALKGFLAGEKKEAKCSTANSED